MLNPMKIFCFKFAVIAACFIPGIANAQISIHGNPNAYTETGGDWLTMGANDIDGSGGLGTDGYIFFGIFDDVLTQQVTYDAGTPDGSILIPSYLTFNGPGADALVNGVSDEGSDWGLIDDPNFVGASNEGDDTRSGYLVSGSGPMGSIQELLVFSIDGLAEDQTVRVGVLGGNHGNQDGLFDPIAIRLSDRNNGASSQTVGSTINSANFLAHDPGGTQAGWVFFDISADGDYAVSAAVRIDNQFGFFTGLGGVTFDSVIGSPFLLGDVNLDESVNFSDIAPFIAVLSAGVLQAEADLNQDGSVTFADIAPFISLLSSGG